jgi:hypothetical protein
MLSTIARLALFLVLFGATYAACDQQADRANRSKSEHSNTTDVLR